MKTGAGARSADIDMDVDAVTLAVLTASRLLVAISVRSLAATQGRVTLAQFRMLVVLAAHGQAKLTTLADKLAVNPSTALRMVERLMAAGLVSREVNPVSRREVVLRVTQVGQQMVDDVSARRHEEIATIVERMSPHQRAALVSALRAFSRAGGEPPAAGQARDLSPLGWA